MDDPLRKARNHMHLGEYNAARKIYQTLSTRDPENVRYHYQLGMCYLGDDNLSEAVKEFESCLGIHPDYVEALIELGDIHFKAGDDDKALYYLRRGCQTDPSHPRARTYLARLYEHLGDYPAAIEHYTKAVEGSEASESPRHDLALALTHNGDLLQAYLILQELLDEADLGLLWSKINQTESGLEELNISVSEEYIDVLKQEMDQIKNQFAEKKGYPIQYTTSMLNALEGFLNLTEREIVEVRREIRMLKHMGLEFEGDEMRFQLHSIEGRFSAFDLGCYLYAAEQLTKAAVSLKGSYHRAFIEALDFFRNHQ